MLLTKNDLLTKQWPAEEVTLPEFDNRAVRVKTLSAGEFMKLAELEKKYPSQGYALWWIASVCDEDGTPLFDEADIDTIKAMPFSAVNRVVEAAKRVNRIPEGKDDESPNA